MPHGAGPADDEHLLPCFDAAAGMHRLPRSEASVGHDGGLFEREAVRLRRELVLQRPGVLGERAPTGSVHLVTDVKSGHALSDRIDPAGHVGAGNRNLRGTEPKSEDPHEVRLAGHEVPGSAVDPGGDDSDKHILLADAGRCDVADLQHVGRPVGVLHDRLHDHHLAISL